MQTKCMVCQQELTEIGIKNDPLHQWGMCMNIKCTVYRFKQALEEEKEILEYED